METETKLTVEEVKKLLPSGRMYELSPDATHIFAYDKSQMSIKQVRELMDHLSELTGRRFQAAIVGYDGYLERDPFHFYEVKR